MDVFRVERVVPTRGSGPEDLGQRPTKAVVGATIGREPHHLVFPIIRFETEVFRHRGIKPAERIGDLDRLKKLELRAGAAPERGAVAVSRTIDDKYERLIHRR